MHKIYKKFRTFVLVCLISCCFSNCGFAVDVKAPVNFESIKPGNAFAVKNGEYYVVNDPNIQESKKSENLPTMQTGSPEVDFGPYMKNLKMVIKKNWSPPRGVDSRRVGVFFVVDKTGGLSKLKISTSSGDPEVDKAAREAIEKSAPFAPLPVNYKGNDVDIQFTFDYNVLGKKRSW